jgi:RimJ/RimL family protein N-acetyltransferase
VEPVLLRTPRTVLSVPAVADVDAVHEACQDAAVQRYTTVPSPYLRSHAEIFVAQAGIRWKDGVEATWAIRQGDRLAGMIGLHRIANGTAEVGYWMSRGARGHGLLTEALRTVVEWGFDADGLGLARIEWRAVVGNLASARAARTAGFRYEGTLRGALSNAFGRDDAWIAGLLRGDDRSPQVWAVLDV